MPLRRIVRLTNTRVRLVVGLLLAALFCIQCTRSEAFRSSSSLVTAVSGEFIGRVSPHRLGELEQLAKADHVALLREALQHYRNGYQDYTCTFIKTERINGQVRPKETIRVKFMEKPFSVAMEWKENPSRADRVLYIKGKYNGQMLVRPKGFLSVLVGTVRRAPDSPDVMANTRRPVTMFGFRPLMESLLEIYEIAAKRGEGTSRFVGYCTIAGRQVMALQRVLPPRNYYPAKTTTWYLDVEYLVPVGLEATDWDDQMIYCYFYTDVKFNVGLSQTDFTPEANEMKLAK